MKKILSSIIVVLACVGCFSSPKKNIGITAVYPFEGRYGSETHIAIDSNEISFKSEDTIWILSNNTLYNLLVSVSDSSEKIVFGKKPYIIKKLNSANLQKDSFDEEKYVWESWNVSTNKAEAFLK